MAELRTFPRSSQRFHSKFVRRGYRSIERSFDSTFPKKKNARARASCVRSSNYCFDYCWSDDRASCKRFVPRPRTSIAADPCRERARIRDT